MSNEIEKLLKRCLPNKLEIVENYIDVSWKREGICFPNMTKLDDYGDYVWRGVHDNYGYNKKLTVGDATIYVEVGYKSNRYTEFWKVEQYSRAVCVVVEYKGIFYNIFESVLDERHGDSPSSEKRFDLIRGIHKVQTAERYRNTYHNIYYKTNLYVELVELLDFNIFEKYTNPLFINDKPTHSKRVNYRANFGKIVHTKHNKISNLEIIKPYITDDIFTPPNNLKNILNIDDKLILSKYGVKYIKLKKSNCFDIQEYFDIQNCIVLAPKYILDKYLLEQFSSDDMKKKYKSERIKNENLQKRRDREYIKSVKIKNSKFSLMFNGKKVMVDDYKEIIKFLKKYKPSEEPTNSEKIKYEYSL